MNYLMPILNQCFILLGIDIDSQIFVENSYYPALSWGKIYMLLESKFAETCPIALKLFELLLQQSNLNDSFRLAK